MQIFSSRMKANSIETMSINSQFSFFNFNSLKYFNRKCTILSFNNLISKPLGIVYEILIDISNVLYLDLKGTTSFNSSFSICLVCSNRNIKFNVDK